MSKNTSKTQLKAECEAFLAVPLMEPEETQQEDEQPESTWGTWTENCLLAILPTLLFIQFGVAYLTETPPQIHWAIVGFGIMCFIATAVVFRKAFSEPESLIALIPEVLIDVILGLILFEKTELAAMIMFCSVAGMGFVASVKMAYCRHEVEEKEVVCRRGDCNA